MKKLFNKNVLIGITVIAAIGIFIWGIEFLKGANLFKPSNFYVAKFENVEGLTESAPITINGYQVGIVRQINYDYDTNLIEVEMSMEKDLKIPMGSTVTLSHELLGGASLSLHLSDNKVYHKVGDEIQTVIQQGLLDKVGEDIMPEVTGILPQVDSIMGNVSRLTGNPALHHSMSRLDLISAELGRSAIELKLLLAHLNNQVPGVVSNVGSMTGKLDGTAGNLNEFTAGLKNLPVDTTLARINQTISNMERLTAQLDHTLNDKNSSLGLLMNDPKLYNNATGAVASLDSLLQDVKQNPKRYINIKVF